MCGTSACPSTLHVGNGSKADIGQPDKFAPVQAAAAENGADTVITFGSDVIAPVSFNAANLAAAGVMF